MRAKTSGAHTMDTGAIALSFARLRDEMRSVDHCGFSNQIEITAAKPC
jgi:hypothetical protein